MKRIAYTQVVETTARLCQEANFYLGQDIRQALGSALETEVSPTGKDILRQLLQNADIASSEDVPMCQDTGVAVVFLNMGQEVSIDGGYLYDAIQDGVRQGYEKGYLRKSIVEHPLQRKNTGDNTPAIIHTQIVPGDQLTITVAPKGGGSENMSAINMFPPSAGEDGVIRFIVETVRKAGPNPCPPIIVGVGLGGNFEVAALLAKKSLLRTLGQPSTNGMDAAMEEKLLEAINKLGIGPQGLGGRTTALAVHVESFPCHIASLPVAVNINCHAARHKSATL